MPHNFEFRSGSKFHGKCDGTGLISNSDKGFKTYMVTETAPEVI